MSASGTGENWNSAPAEDKYEFSQTLRADSASLITLTIIAKVKDDAPDGSISNIATVKCKDLDVPESSDPVDVPVEKPAPVSITKAADKTSAKVGDTINYTVTIVNKTNQQQTVKFKDVLPEGLKLGDSIDQVYTGNDVSNLSGSGLEWSFNLAAKEGAKITFKYSAIVQEGAADSLTNIATATMDGKSYSDTANVTVTKSDPGPGPDPTKYTVTVKYQDEAGKTIRDDATEQVVDGEKYNVENKKVEIKGYTYVSADKELSGTVTGDITIILTYKKDSTSVDPTPIDPDSKHKVTVHYIYENGSEAAGDKVSSNLAEGDKYSITSPVISGYTPSQSEVSGTMGTADIEVTVTYKKNSSGSGGGSGDTPETPDQEKITATWLPGYGNNEPIQTEEYDKGIREIPTTDYPENPVREGYTFDGWNDPVRDGEGNITITAKWKPAGTISTPESHKVTIHYTYADGNKAADDAVRDNLAEGTAYSITSPSINGYTPDQAVVNGTMGTGDVEVTVIYTQNSSNNPDNGSGTESNPGNEGNGNGPGDGGNSSGSGGRGSGGGGGGGSSATNLSGRVHGTTPNPETAVTVPGDGVPLADVPAGEISEGTGADIPDEDVPLAGIPLADIPDADVPLSGFTGLTGIPDEDVPLASVPRTGDHSGLWHMMALLSAFSLMAMTMMDKKKRQEKEQEN